MYNIIPLIFILLSLSVIIFIVSRKFSDLASIDIDTIPEEKASKMKEQIITNRLKRNYYRWLNWTKKIVSPVVSLGGEALKKGYDRLLEIKESTEEKQLEEELSQDEAEGMMDQIKALIRLSEWDQAEQKLIDIISADPQNVQAFKLLGKVYYERKDFNEAKQTLEHVSKLVEKDIDDIYVDKSDQSSGDKKKKDELKSLLSELYYDLSLVYMVIEDNKAANKKISEALKIQPANPRYLDTKLEISIIIKDRIAAEKALSKIKQVNPENQKVGDWEERVNAI